MVIRTIYAVRRLPEDRSPLSPLRSTTEQLSHAETVKSSDWCELMIDASPSLVGRAREHVEISDAVARLGQGAVCLEIVGEQGIGKTTMIDVLRQIATVANAHVLGGRGSEFERDLPFGIFVDAIDLHLSEIDDRWSRNLDADVAAEIARIFPARRSPEAQGRPVRSGERFRTHRAVRALLERLAATRPVVLALDDVQWADSSSVELIGSLLRRPPDARVLIALAYRPHQAPARLLRELAVAAGDGVLRRIELGPLSRSEADALLTAATTGRDRVRLFTESGGNPFYLHQLARTPGDGRAGRDLGAGVPFAVAASLFAELESVSVGARRFAQAAAVSGDPIDLDLAGQIGGLDRSAALTALDELIGADLVRDGGGPLGFAFRHPLVRRAVYESAQPGWRIEAHALADAAMAGRGASPTARAHHVEQSAGIGDEQAIGLLVAAAAAAVVPGAAAHWLTAALRLVPADSAQRLGLLCGLGEALAAAGLLEQSRAALVEALSRWPGQVDREGRTGLIVVCAIVERLLGRHQQGRARLVAAAAELDDPDCPAGVALTIELAAERIFAPDFATARGPAAAALQGAIGLGDPVLRAAAVTIAGFADYCVSDLNRARRQIAEASELVAAIDDAALAMRPDVLFNLGWIERFLDHFEAAVGHFDRGLALARASGRSQLYVELTAGRANALYCCGRLVESQAAADDAVEAARLSENPLPLAWALLMSCVTQTSRGDVAGALDSGQEGVALAVDGSTISAGCGVQVGMALGESGDWSQTVQLILTWGGGPELSGLFPMLRPWAYEALTRAEIARGSVDQAAEWAHRAHAVVDGVPCDLPRAQADRAHARVLLARGDVAAAAELALASATRADGVSARLEAGSSRLLAGRALAAAGLREDAAAHLRAAEAQLATCGALRLREECVRELRRIGRRVARAGARGDDGAPGVGALSGREREVAELVRERHTNREIAARLFLSEKTIESHLRSVFVKLGVRSRADAARALDVHHD